MNNSGLLEKPKLRWGIISSGKIAQDFASALRHVPDAELVAVAARELSSASEFAQRFGLKRFYGSYEELVKDDQVDAVYISSPHTLHKDHTLLALRHGKHVLCEKSFATNAKEAEEMINLARANKMFLMEAMWTRFFPAIQKLRELIRNGSIGVVKSVHASFGFCSDGSMQRLVDLNLGAGALLDVGVYCVAFASWVFGPDAPSTIVAHGDLHPKHGYDEQLAIILGYQPGEMAVLIQSMVAEIPKEVYINGTTARIKIHEPFWSPEKITITKNARGVYDKVTGEKGIHEELTFPHPAPLTADEKYNFRNSIGLQFEAAHATKCILEGKTESPEMSLNETLTIMKTMDKVREIVGLKYPSEK